MRTVDTGRLRLLILQEFADIVADVTFPSQTRCVFCSRLQSSVI